MKLSKLTVAFVVALAALTVCSMGSVANAVVTPKAGRYQLYALLVLEEGTSAYLYLNPLSRARFEIRIENPELVARHLGARTLVRKVTVDLVIDPNGLPRTGQATTAKVLDIELSGLSKLPIYDSHFELVAPRKD